MKRSIHHEAKQWQGRHAMRRCAIACSAVLALGTLACGGSDADAPANVPMSQATSASQPTDGTPGIQSLSLSPRSPVPGDKVQAEVQLSADSPRGTRLEYEWTVDGRRVSADSATLHVDGSARKGSSIEVSVVAVDPKNERSAPQEASLRVGNTPPVLHSIRFEPLAEVTANQDITAVPQANDADSDILSYEFYWAVNGESVRENGPVLAASHFDRGDEITVRVRASDGTDQSEEIRSQPIPVRNASPRIVSTPGGLDSAGAFSYAVQVEDPDGDSRFSYRLLEKPAGMSIDGIDGTLRWVPEESQAGRHPVTIEVADSQGGRATQTFTMEVAFEEVSDSPPAAQR